MSDSTRSGFGSTIPGKRRKSIFRRIADSLSSFVPSVILPQNKCETTASEVQDSVVSISEPNSRERMVSDSRISDKIGLPGYEQYGLDVDLDAVDNSDEEISAHTSTSGVSSLLPRTARSRIGHFPEFSVGNTTLMNSEPPCPDIAAQNSWTASLTKKADSYIQRPAKKPRLSNPSSDSIVDERRSPFYLSKTTYGGAASCRSWRRRDLFEPTVPLRFELESTRSESESASGSGSNLSSAARHILQSLERFSSPLSVADRVPLPFSAGAPQGPMCLPKSFRSHRYPPYLQAYNHLKSLRQRTSVSDQQTTLEVTKSLPATTVSAPTSTTAQIPSVVSTSSVHFTLGFEAPFSTASTMEVNYPRIVPSTVSSGALPTPSLTSVTSTFSFAPPIRRPASAASQLALATANNNATKYDFSTPTRLTRSSTSERISPISQSKVPQTATTTSPVLGMILSPSAADQPKLSSAGPPPLPFGSFPTWRCETCLMENVTFREKCSGCGLSKPAKDALTSAAVSSVSGKSTSEQWTCRSCSRLNNANSDACAQCHTPRSDAISPNQPTTNPSQPPAISQSNAQKWQCPTCLVCNDLEKLSCPCCQTPKPVKQPVSDDRWKCPSCSRLNDPGKISCPCQTSTANSLSTSAVVSSTQNQWECPTCLVRNSFDKLTCPCCTTPQPGSSNSTKLSLPKLPDSNPVLPANTGFPFRFGLPSTTQPAAVTNTSTTSTIAAFSFGIPPSSVGQSSVSTSASAPSSSTVSSCSAETVSLSKLATTCSENKPVISTVSGATVGFTLPKFSFSAPWTNPVTTSTTTATTAVSSTCISSTVPSGQPSVPKLLPVNGLVNGDSPGLFGTKLNAFDPQPSVTLFNGLPKFDFSSTSQSTGASGFQFGFAPSSTVTPATLPIRSDSSSTAQPVSTPFVFGSSIASSAASNVFSPGSLNQRSSSPPAGNVFSVSDSVPARRKLHAVRRFQR